MSTGSTRSSAETDRQPIRQQYLLVSCPQVSQHFDLEPTGLRRSC